MTDEQGSDHAPGSAAGADRGPGPGPAPGAAGPWSVPRYAPPARSGAALTARQRAAGGRTPPELSPAQQHLIEHSAARRQARRYRLMLSFLGATSALTLVASGGAWALTSYVSSSLHRVNAGTSGTPASGPINILVAGIDTRGGLTRHQEVELHVGNDISSNSDTLMLVHIPGNHASVQVVSIPRDSWVNIPGHGMNKINAAFGLGGPQLMVRTVEQATGVTINDYIEVDFLGFVKVINALGGVNVCVPFAVDDSYSGLKLSAGMHHVDGVTALKFVRDRHSFALSDIARIGDQQQLLSSMFAEVTQTGVLANPIRLEQFLSSVTAAVQVDQGFNLIRLADELRGLRPSNVTFTTVPLASINYVTPTGLSAVLWNKAQADALFSWLNKDTGTALPRHHGKRAHPHASPSPHAPASAHGSAKPNNSVTLARAQVSVDVYNGTQISKLSADTGRALASRGFTIHRSGLNWSDHHLAQSLIEYPPGHLAAARLLAAVMPGARVQAVPGLARIRLILGSRGHQVIGKPTAAHVQPTPVATSEPGQIRTAAQAACS